MYCIFPNSCIISRLASIISLISCIYLYQVCNNQVIITMIGKSLKLMLISYIACIPCQQTVTALDNTPQLIVVVDGHCRSDSLALEVTPAYHLPSHPLLY